MINRMLAVTIFPQRSALVGFSGFMLMMASRNDTSPMAEIKDMAGMMATRCVGRGGNEVNTPKKKNPARNHVNGMRYCIFLKFASVDPNPRMKKREEPGPVKPKMMW